MIPSKATTIIILAMTDRSLKSFSFIFSSFLTVYLLFKCRFCGLIKGISPKICILCVRVKINKRSFEPFCALDLIEA